MHYRLPLSGRHIVRTIAGPVNGRFRRASYGLECLKEGGSSNCLRSVSVESLRYSPSLGEILGEGGPANVLIRLVASFLIRFYEPRGREFESLQARQVINTYLLPVAAKPSGCVIFERLAFFQAIASQYTGSSRYRQSVTLIGCSDSMWLGLPGCSAWVRSPH
jgi:hypothetical protein